MGIITRKRIITSVIGVVALCGVVAVLSSLLEGREPNPPASCNYQLLSGEDHTPATYYVNAETGNNDQAGSENQPWQSIQHGVEQLRPGDRLVIQVGDYREIDPLICIKTKGTESRPVVIQSSADATVTVESILLFNSSRVTIQGLTVTGPKEYPDKWKDMPEVVVDDPSIKIDTQEWWLFRHPKVDKKYATYHTMFHTWQSEWTVGIQIRRSEHITLAKNNISRHSTGIGISGESSSLTIDSNEIHHNMIALLGTLNRNDQHSFTHSVIKNNTVYQHFASGIRVTNQADRVEVVNNTVSYAGTGHIDTHTGSTNVTIRNNTLSYGGYYAEAMENPGPSAISIHTSGDGNQVLGNLISFQRDITLRDGNGIIIDQTKPKVIIANNIVYRCMGSGITSAYSGNNVIVHNTLVENGYQTTSKWNGVGIRSPQPQDVNNIIANNILYKNSRGGMHFNGRLPDQKYVDYNLYFLAPDTPLVSDSFDDESRTYYDLESLQQTGFGEHSLVADPLFTNPAEQEYTLQPDSPARDRGTREHTFTHDIRDVQRLPDGTVDIGAYEFKLGEE